ncbi:hypothetical protein HPB49_001903 [Dermacentor silvarum]|uniref:Uncharacterized protein n=1 Tax=Dermacentor silvarum TaxID=543639 RepID=A0ACB8DAA1_DERSI|nr:hypothetical protein HPB49_001903 [Dermacentor silvarum]
MGNYAASVIFRCKRVQCRFSVIDVSLIDEPVKCVDDTGAHVMHHVFSQGEIEGKLVADLGCGAGILSIGAAVLNAGQIVGFDIDAAALQMCLQNCTEMEIATMDMIQWDLALPPDMRWKGAFDTVVMNPPFGTRTKGK